MDSSFVIQTLRQHEGELKRAGIVHLRLFGSVARNEASQHSDIDLLAEFDKSRRLSLVIVGSIQSRLSELLGVDAISPRLSGDEGACQVREPCARPYLPFRLESITLVRLC